MFYDAFKDVIDIAQKVDNVDLYRKLLDLSRDALDLQNELDKYVQENGKLKREIEQEKNIVRHRDGGYITIKDDMQQIQYCSTCWGSDHKLIQLLNEGPHPCPICMRRLLEARNK